MTTFERNATPEKVSRKATALRVLSLAAALAAWGSLAPPAMAQGATIDAAAEHQLTAASANGPTALLHALDEVLRANPALAATPDRAAALARVAGAPVAGFVGAAVPIYRAITDRIVAAAPATQSAAVRQAVAATLGRMAIVVPAGVQKPGTRVGQARQADLGGPGYRVGSFTIYPDIQAATVFDSNIYATRTQRRSDVLATVSPQIRVESNWDRNSLTAVVQTDLTGYSRSPHENSVDWNAAVEGRIDATATTQVLLGGTAISSHEDRSSPDAVDGYSPTPYMETNGYAGVIQRVGDFSVRIGTAIERTTFSNVDSANGTINNQDRNRNRYTFGTLIRYDRNPGFRPYVEALGDLRRYDSQVDDFGYARSSDGYRAGVGALFRLTPTLRGDAFVGVLGRKADDVRFKGVTAAAFNGTLRWQAARGTLLVAYVDRTLEETTLSGSPGYLYTAIGGRVEQALTDKLTGLVRLSWGHSEFLQSTRADDETDVSTGLRYALNAKVTLGVDYRYTRRASNVSLANYDRNELYFRIGSQF